MRWDQQTSAELDAVDRAIPVILPTAAVEQHGPHLPLATDQMIVDHFCRTLDAGYGDDVLILPTMAVGCSAHHLDFPGSLSISHPTFLSQAEEILDCVVQHGFDRIVIFNAHGGNQGIDTVLLERFGHEHPNCHIAYVTWWHLASKALTPLNESGRLGTGHACEFETSLLLYADPDSVRHSLIEDSILEPVFPWAQGDMLQPPQGSYYRTLKQMSANGVFGRPSMATADKGKQITEIVLAKLRTILSDLRKAPNR